MTLRLVSMRPGPSVPAVTGSLAGDWDQEFFPAEGHGDRSLSAHAQTSGWTEKFGHGSDLDASFHGGTGSLFRSPSAGDLPNERQVESGAQ